jgi:hypothetical protein
MAVPKSALFTLPPAIFQTAVRFRLREAQPVAWPVTRCSCGHALDEAATHYIHRRGAPGVGGGNFFTSVEDAMLREVTIMLRTVYPRGQVVTLLCECMAVQEDRLDVEGRHSTWACRTFSSFWKQRLSVTLARRLACVILLCAQEAYRHM